MHDHFISFKNDQQEQRQTVWVLLTLTLPRAFSSGQTGGPALPEGRGGLHLSSSLRRQAGCAEESREHRRRAWRGGQVARPGTFLCGWAPRPGSPEGLCAWPCREPRSSQAAVQSVSVSGLTACPSSPLRGRSHQSTVPL